MQTRKKKLFLFLYRANVWSDTAAATTTAYTNDLVLNIKRQCNPSLLSIFLSLVNCKAGWKQLTSVDVSDV